MRFKYRTKIPITVVALCLATGLVHPHSVMAQPPAAKAKTGQPGGINPFAADSRVQERTYAFVEMKYCLFVSSQVSKDKKAPLIVTLHGLGAGPSIMLTKDAVDLAEKGGYILVAPMGYNERGWYGIPMGPMPGLNKVPPKPAAATGEGQPDAKAAPKSKMGGMFSNPNDPPNLRELSEKEVMNVLDIVRKEFNVDENRIYLMGHSMGGAGTLHLGFKYPSIWAALAPVAPAAFSMSPDILANAKDMPVMIVHGAADEVVPVANTHQWVEKLKELKMTYEYNEMPGVSHGPVITASLPSVFEFFGKHSKSAK